MNFAYIFALFALCLIYVVGLWFMKYIRPSKFVNLLFGCLVFIPHIWRSLIIYMNVGFYDWNFQNILPVANVSPFMFALTFLLLFFPHKIKKHFYLLISLLTAGMFVSPLLGCINNAAIDYKFHLHFMLDYVAHIFLSLFGIYLIRSKQVIPTFKNCVVSSSIILGTAATMLILNLIFDTSFFGLSLRGKHNIYNHVLVDNSFVSTLLYFLGLTFVLLLGFAVCKMFKKEKWAVKQN